MKSSHCEQSDSPSQTPKGGWCEPRNWEVERSKFTKQGRLSGKPPGLWHANTRCPAEEWAHRSKDQGIQCQKGRVWKHNTRDENTTDQWSKISKTRKGLKCVVPSTDRKSYKPPEEKLGTGKGLSIHPLITRTHRSNDQTKAGQSTDESPTT
jgi:hypothetical protein